MRLYLLQMCFGKHIERKHCCFFAGSILDEVLQVLHHVRVTPVLGRPYKVTDELFDLSTMAMEYFKEHIEPGLPDPVYFTKSFLNFSSECPSGLRESPHAPPRSMPPPFLHFSERQPKRVDVGQHILASAALATAHGAAQGHPQDQTGHEEVRGQCRGE